MGVRTDVLSACEKGSKSDSTGSLFSSMMVRNVVKRQQMSDSAGA